MSLSQNIRGITLIQVLIAMTMMTVVAWGVMQLMSQINNASLRANVTSNAQIIRQNILEILNNDIAWQNTLKDPANLTFDCFQNLKDCSVVTSLDPDRKFQIRDASNKVRFDGRFSHMGLTMQGEVCITHPSPECPFRTELHWRALCGETKPCHFPQMELNGRIVYDTGPSAIRRVTINPENYKFQIVKNMQLPLMPLTAPSSGSTLQHSEPSKPVQQAPSTESKSVQQQQLEVLCTLIGDQAFSDEVMTLVKQQLAAMGISGADAQVNQLKQTCASFKK